MYPAGQPRTRYLRGYPYNHCNGGQCMVNNIQTLRTQYDYPLATSWSGIPPSANPQYTSVPLDSMTTRTTLTGGSAGGPYIPRSYVQNLPELASPSTSGGPYIPRFYAQNLPELTSPSTFFGDNHNVPVSELDAPQTSSSLLQETLEGLQEYPLDQQLLGYMEYQVSMPARDAPQGSSCLPNHNGLFFEGPASADSSPLVPHTTHVVKRKRSVSFVENDERRQNPTLSTHAHRMADRTPRVPKKADFDPVHCPFCTRRITRPRRLPGHVRICQALQKHILTYQFSEKETVDAIRKWGIPKFISDKFSEAKNSNKELRDREDFIRSLSDEEVVQKLIEWGVPESTLKHFSSALGVNESSTPQAGPSHPQTVASDYRTVIEDLASSGSLATPWRDTYDTSSESSSSQYTEESFITNFAPTPSPYAEKQVLCDGNSGTFGLPDGQANEYLIGFDGGLTPPSTLFGSGHLDKYVFDRSELGILAEEPIDVSGASV
ncbi:hypothetical protein E4T56_gene19261 [Termitomyces sp. T112]|nr:hypothetical protein E4T56_gene19261 [Termitomyces sp. T112]